MNLSDHFTIEELTVTEQRDLLDDNLAYAYTPDHLANLKRLAAGLEAVRALLAAPIHINSGIRCPVLNAKVGGSPSSQHMQGLAADFTCAGYGVPYDVARAIAASEIAFDQLIYEFGRWVHISFPAAGATARRSVLSIHSAKVGYVSGIVLKGMA